MAKRSDSGSGARASLGSAAPPESVLRAVIDLTDDAVVTCDLEHAVTSFSPNAERLFGQPVHEVLGGPVRVLFPRHLTNEVEGVFATVATGERILHFETEVVRPDGLPIPISLSLAPLADDGGVVVGSVVVARDVTEQHLAQATLAEIDARIEEGEALSHVGSWIWDLRTGAVQWSAEFHRIHEVDPMEFAGTLESYLQQISDQDRGRVRKAMAESTEATKPLDIEYRVLHPDQRIQWVRVHASPALGSDGNVVGLRGVGRDVTGQGSPNSMC